MKQEPEFDIADHVTHRLSKYLLRLELKAEFMRELIRHGQHESIRDLVNSHVDRPWDVILFAFPFTRTARAIASNTPQRNFWWFVSIGWRKFCAMDPVLGFVWEESYNEFDYDENWQRRKKAPVLKQIKLK
jgi:hypothetical protein